MQLWLPGGLSNSSPSFGACLRYHTPHFKKLLYFCFGTILKSDYVFRVAWLCSSLMTSHKREPSISWQRSSINMWVLFLSLTYLHFFLKYTLQILCYWRILVQWWLSMFESKIPKLCIQTISKWSYQLILMYLMWEISKWIKLRSSLL